MGLRQLLGCIFILLMSRKASLRDCPADEAMAMCSVPKLRGGIADIVTNICWTAAWLEFPCVIITRAITQSGAGILAIRICILH
eukprot:10268277-Karenia_brevis.AAC.1